MRYVLYYVGLLQTITIYEKSFVGVWDIYNLDIYRVFAGNLQKRNWKIDTSMGPIGAQNLFSSLYKLG